MIVFVAGRRPSGSVFNCSMQSHRDKETIWYVPQQLLVPCGSTVTSGMSGCSRHRFVGGLLWMLWVISAFINAC